MTLPPDGGSMADKVEHDHEPHERTYTIFHGDGPITLTEHELLNDYMRLRGALIEITVIPSMSYDNRAKAIARNALSIYLPLSRGREFS